MKLAEALQERADLSRHIEQLRERLQNNAIVQENEEPAEHPDTLMARLNADITWLESDIARINLTNCQTKVKYRKPGDSRAKEYTLTELLACRDALKLKISVYRDLISAASQIGRRSTRSEVRFSRTVNVKELQEYVDEMSKELRELDNFIQGINWTTELI